MSLPLLSSLLFYYTSVGVHAVADISVVANVPVVALVPVVADVHAPALLILSLHAQRENIQNFIMSRHTAPVSSCRPACIRL
jgi:hypothetical protein